MSDFSAARHRAEQAQAFFLAARCDFISGATKDGLRHSPNAAALWESMGDPTGHALARALVARCLLEAGEGGPALDHGLAALSLSAQPEPDRPSAALQAALLTLGIVSRRVGQLDTARDDCQQAVDCAVALSDRVAQGAAIDTLACVCSSFAAAAREAGHGLAVTASIGVAWGGEAGSAEGLLALADQRLCAAKGRGRNCVVST